MLRTTLSVLAGLVLGFACVFAVEMLSVKLFPFPPDVDPHDMAQVQQAMKAGRFPTGGLIAVLAGQALGAGVAAFVAARIARASAALAGGIAGGLMFAASVANLFALPHPLFFTVTTLISVPAAAWLGTAPGRRRTPAA